jgi:preprotein translocase subunit YajC
MTSYGVNALLAQQVQQDPNAVIKMIGMMAIFAVIMWVLMIAPQRKKAKEQDLMLKALRAGDKIVTASGIIGVVLSIKDKSVSIRSADTKLEILKSAVADVTERGGESSETKS